MPDDDRNQDQSASPSQWEPPPAVGELPDRLRVHSLARVLGTTSKRVLDALAGLDGRSRSPQSSVEQAEAIRVRDVLAAAEIASAQAAADLLAETEAETEVASPEAELVTQLTFIDPTAAVIIESEPESRLILEDHSASSHTVATAEHPVYMPLFVAPQPLTAPAPVAADPTAPGRPVAITGSTADLPRLFSGTLVLAKRAFINPNPPYDFQLTDSNNRRFAYVDTRRLVLTDKIENFLGLQVVVTGTIRNTVDGKDLVVDAEAMVHK